MRWPEEGSRLDELRAVGAPRLVFVESGREPPASEDVLEDWVRVPVDDVELRARVRTLTTRAGRVGAQPELDDDGLLRYRGRWVDLPGVERALAAALLERFGAVVGRESLARRAWPNTRASRNALDVHMSRLRRRIAPLGLRVRTVRSRGYLLHDTAAGGGSSMPA